MAEGVVSFLLERIESFVLGEWELLKSVNPGIASLKRELESMTALLKDADARGEHDHVVRAWIQQVRDQVYGIENVMDMFVLHLARQRKQPHEILTGGSRSLTRFKAHHSIATQIQDINANLESIKQIKDRYAITTSSSSSSSSSSSFSSSQASSFTFLVARVASLFVEDVDLIGIEEPKGKLISWALEESRTLKVMFVVGMGGSGKTALVKKVYENVKEKFDCHAWITFSTSEDKLEILWNIFNRLHNLTRVNAEPLPIPQISGGRISPLNEVDLVDKLRNHLQNKRYVIVLDDLWNKDVWESIRFALPGSTTSSRIIITTRRGDIASSCSDSSIDVHNLEPLRPEKAQELLYKKAFPQNNGNCPSGLDESSWLILSKCEGLPLGIIEIGLFLSNRQKTKNEWTRLHDGLESELRRDGRLSNIMKVLSISYNDLPYHLKCCLLYFSNFPGYYAIKRRRLIRLWMAEGFIRRETGKELEDVGEEYLKELIERSLIQVSEWDFDGRPKSCRVHNLMHKIIISIARDENFCAVYNEIERNVISEKTTRRLSIQQRGFNMSQKDFSSARALFMFETETSPWYHYSNIPSSLELLKVLHLEGARLNTFPSEIVKLLLLRYLCLSNTQIAIIPKSVGNLCHLETLDLKQTLVRKLPEEIIKLDKLRHLFVCKYNIGSYVTFDCVEGFEVSAKISKLINLQKLSFVKANGNHDLIGSLRYLTQLRKLGIIDLLEADGPILCDSIQMLRNLQSLNVTSLHKEQCLHLQKINNPPRLLQRLYLKGRLERLPDWVSRLHDLVRIRLKWSRLAPENNPIAILQDLPNLLELQLLDAYTGNQLHFNVGKFQSLKILEFEQLEQLRMVVLEIGTLPCLEKVIIRKCGHLQQVPVGIDSLTLLKELHLCDMPLDFVCSLERNTGELRHLVQHISKIHSYHLHSEGYWVLEDLS